jgi:hypothetical protein
MELILLRLYQCHVATCCRAVLFGLEDIEASNPQVPSERFWYGVQNLVTGAGNASKALWGQGNNPKRYAERQPLRDSLSVTDASPLREVKIRNDYEHLDERLEHWWKTSPNHNVIDAMVAPRGSIVGNALGEKDTLRWLDPTTGDVIFWGNELNIPTVVAEVQRILPIAEAEGLKPHWETPAQNQTSDGGGEKQVP